MIESYSFGVVVIDGKRYTSDVIVFPERVISGWWRREGHKLAVEDLKEILEMKPKPEVLVVGTGYSGLVKVSREVEQRLEREGIELVAQHTREACETFNRLLSQGKHVAAALHLTC